MLVSPPQLRITLTPASLCSSAYSMCSTHKYSWKNHHFAREGWKSTSGNQIEERYGLGVTKKTNTLVLQIKETEDLCQQMDI